MDNLTEGLYIAASILIFILALSATMFLFTQLVETGEVVFEKTLRPKFATYVEVKEKEADIYTGKKRLVSKSDIIPELYRYASETLSITILNKEGKEIQTFDKDIDTALRTALKLGANRLNLNQRQILDRYNDVNSTLYLFGVPWLGDAVKARERVDLFIYGEKGYIGITPVDYTDKGLNDLFPDPKQKFTETILRYKISGEGLYNPETNTEVVTTELRNI